MLPLQSILPSLVFLILALCCGWQAKALQDQYREQGSLLSMAASKQMEAQEKRWRIYTHVLCAVCLLPIPFLLFFPVAALADLGVKALGATAVSGAVLALLKLGPTLKFGKLFTADIGWANQLVLVVLGLALGSVLTLLLVVLLDPALRSALLSPSAK